MESLTHFAAAADAVVGEFGDAAAWCRWLATLLLLTTTDKKPDKRTPLNKVLKNMYFSAKYICACIILIGHRVVQQKKVFKLARKYYKLQGFQRVLFRNINWKIIYAVCRFKKNIFCNLGLEAFYH